MLSKMKSAPVAECSNDNATAADEVTIVTRRRTGCPDSVVNESTTDKYSVEYPGQESDEVLEQALEVTHRGSIRIAVFPSGAWEVIGSARVSFLGIDQATLEDLTEGEVTTDELLEGFADDEDTIPYLVAAEAAAECAQ